MVLHYLPERPEQAGVPAPVRRTPPSGARAGFVVGKAVGNSVVRHRVTRRLRAVGARRAAPAARRPPTWSSGPAPRRPTRRFGRAAPRPRRRPGPAARPTAVRGRGDRDRRRRSAGPCWPPSASTRGRSARPCRRAAASTRPAAPTPPRRSSCTAPAAAAGWRCAGWSSARPGTPAASTSSPGPASHARNRGRRPLVEHVADAPAAAAARPSAPSHPAGHAPGRARSPPLLDWLYTAISWVMKQWHALFSTFLGPGRRASPGRCRSCSWSSPSGCCCSRCSSSR